MVKLVLLQVTVFAGMATYRLTYFKAKGRAELIRWIFSQAGVKFEDCRIEEGDWPTLKSKTPYHTLPILEFDGKTLGGSGPIARYVAEKHGLAGSNDFENADLAGIYDMVNDMVTEIYKFVFEGNDEAKTKLKEALVEEKLPKFLGILESRITENGCPEGWSYGSKITYVDMWIALSLDLVVMVDENVSKTYPAVLKLKGTVEAQPNIAKWIKERPQTQY